MCESRGFEDHHRTSFAAAASVPARAFARGWRAAGRWDPVCDTHPGGHGAGRSGASTSRTLAIGTDKMPPLVAGDPLEVASASLAQDSLDLVWRVQLAEPFAPGALARDHRALCLLIERVTDGTVAAQGCVAGRGPHGEPKLMYEPVGANGPRARLRRSSPRSHAPAHAS